jgi:hypothetical protein
MRRAVLAVLVTIVGLVLLLSFKPHQLTAFTDRPAAISGENGGPVGSDGGPAPGGTTGSGGDTTSGDAGAAQGGRTINGDVAGTRWGPVQVQIVISSGRMTGITVLQAPDGNARDIAIDNEALPILHDEALSAQSAQIDTVSGATYTSDGYIRSLQSALDRAGL